MARDYTFEEVEKIIRLARREIDMRDQYAGKSIKAVNQNQYDGIIGMRDALSEFKEFFPVQIDFFKLLAQSLEDRIDNNVDDIPF